MEGECGRAAMAAQPERRTSLEAHRVRDLRLERMYFGVFLCGA